jgi:hypothetical protein
MERTEKKERKKARKKERKEERKKEKERKKERKEGRPFKDASNVNKICWRNLMIVVRRQLP